MNKFRKKPVVIEAIQWDGRHETIKSLEEAGMESVYLFGDRDVTPELVVKTLEGEMRADPGDWIIKGVKGEFYPCKPDIFAATYDRAAGEDPNARSVDLKNHLAGRLWTAYRTSCGAKTFRGDHMPTWEEMLADASKKDLVQHWIVTAGEAWSALVLEGSMTDKTLHNSDVSGARKNVPDLEVFGDGDMFKLLCKASSQKEGWMKSTKAMTVGAGSVVQVTTQQKNPDGSYSVAEALAFVPGCRVIEQRNTATGKVIARALWSGLLSDDMEKEGWKGRSTKISLGEPGVS